MAIKQEISCRYFGIGGLTIRVEADLPITDITFNEKLKAFEEGGPGDDMIVIRHHFSLPDPESLGLGQLMYRQRPWAIYRQADSWIYLGILDETGNKDLFQIAIFNNEHSQADIYHRNSDVFSKGGCASLTLFPTDQILLARVLADRAGFYLHSCGVDFNGQGLLFAGHSEAGKSTMARMLAGQAKILCDDRIIIRNHPEGARIYGTWHHGDVPDILPASVPLQAILFLEKAPENRLILMEDRAEIMRRLLACIIRPFVTADWWAKSLDILERTAGTIPCYVLKCDKSGAVVDLLKKL